jgi:hypothetical protein
LGDWKDGDVVVSNPLDTSHFPYDRLCPPKYFTVDLRIGSASGDGHSLDSHKDGSSTSIFVSSRRDPYLLRLWSSLQLSFLGGLGFVAAKDPWPSKVGKKYSLKHAQEKVTCEVSQSRQHLISMVLRAGLILVVPQSRKQCYLM